MEKLSQALESLPNITPQQNKSESGQNCQPLGSALVAGTTNIQARPEPLTESQLTQIASKLLLKMPSISLIKKKITGTKTIDDEYGSHIVDGVVVGEEDDVEVKVYLRDGLNREIIEAALRQSPPSAITNHLQRLAMHKRLGSSDRDRTVLLHDYADALRLYSDFIVYVACKMFWENDKDAFFPKIKPLREVCEILYQFFNKMLDAPNLPGALSAPKPERQSYYSDPYPHPIRRALCDYLIAKGEPGGDLFRSSLYSNYDLEKMAAKYGWSRSS